MQAALLRPQPLGGRVREPRLATRMPAVARTVRASASATASGPVPLRGAVPEPVQFDVPAALPLNLLPTSHAWTEVAGGVCAPRGFQAQGAYAGLRDSSHRADLALLVSNREALVACVPGAGEAPAPAVDLNRERLAACPTAKAVLMTASDGVGGFSCCGTAVDAVAQALSCASDKVLLLSIGGCGDVDRMAILPAINHLAATLDGGAEGAYHAACVLTATDTTCKSASLEVQLGQGRTVRLGGMAHGDARGLQAVVTCDAPVIAPLWQAMFERALAGSFRQMALAGHRGGATPTDSVLAMANGAAGGALIWDEEGAEAQLLEEALIALMQGLAKEVAWDAVGSRCLVEVEVGGAASFEAAGAVALAVARSSAVCAAVQACNPDWLTIADAASRSGVELQHAVLRIAVGGMPLLHHGHPTELASSAAAYCSEYMHAQIGRRGTVKVRVSIGEGPGVGKAWGSGTCGGGRS